MERGDCHECLATCDPVPGVDMVLMRVGNVGAVKGTCRGLGCGYPQGGAGTAEREVGGVPRDVEIE